MKRQFIKRICSALIIFALLLTSFTSCNRSYDEEEVISAAKELLKSAEKLNYIYFGEGIRYIDSDNAISVYKEADKAHLEELGFDTVDELKELTQKTFSSAYSQILYSTILDTLRDGENIVGYKRYYYDEAKGIMMVNTSFKTLLYSTNVYNYDSIKVNGSKEDKVYLTVSSTVINEKGKSKVVDLTITLIEEEVGWRLDNPVYANYSLRE